MSRSPVYCRRSVPIEGMREWINVPSGLSVWGTPAPPVSAYWKFSGETCLKASSCCSGICGSILMFLFGCFCCARCSVSAGRAGLPADRLTSFCFITHYWGAPLCRARARFLPLSPQPGSWPVLPCALSRVLAISWPPEAWCPLAHGPVWGNLRNTAVEK